MLQTFGKSFRIYSSRDQRVENLFVGNAASCKDADGLSCQTFFLLPGASELVVAGESYTTIAENLWSLMLETVGAEIYVFKNLMIVLMGEQDFSTDRECELFLLPLYELKFGLNSIRTSPNICEACCKELGVKICTKKTSSLALS